MSAVALKKIHDQALPDSNANKDNNNSAEAKQSSPLETGGEDAARKIQKAQEALESSIPLFLKTTWDLSVNDIEKTTKRVCRKLLNDGWGKIHSKRVEKM